MDASHFIYKAIHNTIGLKYTVSFDYFIPSGQSNIDQIQLGSALWGGTVTNLTTVDAWTSVEKTFIANITQISFLASDGGSTLFSDAGSDDVFYIRNIVSTQTGQTLHLSANHCDGTTLIDLTGNGNNGTNNGALLQNVPVSTVIENHTETDSDEGRAVSTYYLGRQSGGERFVQGKVEASHNGSADDKKSQVKIYTHNGTDLTLAVTIDENQKAAFADSIAAVGNVSGATYAGDHSVSDAELRRINSLSSNVQAQLDAKEDSLSGYRIPKADGDWDGEFFVSTAGESVVFGDVLYRKSDSKWWKVDADAEASMPGLVIVAVATIAADASDTLMTKGFMFEADWTWTVGNGTANMLFCDDGTAGDFVQTVNKPSNSGDILQCVGWVYSAKVVFFDPSKVWTEVQ